MKRSISHILITICIIVVRSADLNAQAALPPEAHADVLKRKIVDAYSAQHGDELLALMDEYYELETPQLRVPPTLRIVEAKTAYSMGLRRRAYCALTGYLSVARREESTYTEALELYKRYESDSNAITSNSEPEIERKYCEDRARPIASQINSVRSTSTDSLPPSAVSQPGTIVFYRVHKYLMSLEPFQIRNSSGQLGLLSDGSFFTVAVPAGHHELFLRDSHNGPEAVQELEVKSGETYYIRGWCTGLDCVPHLEVSDQTAYEQFKARRK